MAGNAGMAAGAVGMMSMVAASNAMGAAARSQRAAQLAAEKGAKQRRENDTFTQCALDNLRSALRCKEVLKIQGIDLMEDPEFTELLAQLNGIEYGFGAKEVFRRLQQTLTDGTYREKFPVGRILPDKWTDPKNRKVIDAPLRIVDYREVRLADNSRKMAAILMRQYAVDEYVAYDKKKRTKWSDSTAYEYLNTEYVNSCSESLREALATTIIDGAYTKFFVPSLEELHVLNDPKNESLTWEYFMDTSIKIKEKCEKRDFRGADGHSVSCWTRTPSPEFQGDVYELDYGSIYSARASKEKHLVPVCAIVGE